MGALAGDSNSKAIPAVEGTNSADGNGVYGVSAKSDAVVGLAQFQGKAGVLGLAPNGNAVAGISDNSVGVYGQGKTFGSVFNSPGNAVNGTSTTSDAIVGTAQAQGKAGVLGLAPNGNAVAGISDNSVGVYGQGKTFGSVFNSPGNAVNGTSTTSDAIVGTAQAQGKAGVLGLAPNGNAVAGISDNATGVYGQGAQFGVWATSPNIAGHFEGNIEVTGDIRLTGGDCAERFDVACFADSEPGTVMSIGQDGSLRASTAEYDPHVAGVIAGAGDLHPAIILGEKAAAASRRPLALIGQVYCKVIADGKPIAAGDPLTSSSLPGHAMRADDVSRSVGALIGKALQPLTSGTGLIRILVALR